MTGLVYIFTGEGKGKTSAALGTAVRAALSGLRVAWVAWYKEPSWKVSEFELPKVFPNIKFYVGGKGFYLAQEKGAVLPVGKAVVVDKATASEHQLAAQAALEKATALVTAGACDVLILDEICQAVDEKLVDIATVEKLIINRGQIHLVLTGRHCSAKLMDLADTVSEVKKVKHAYDAGIMAVKGLDF